MASNIGGPGSNLANLRVQADLANRSGATNTATTAAVQPKAPKTTKSVKGGTGDGVQLSPQAQQAATAEDTKRMQEQGDFQELAHHAGVDLNSGQYKRPDEEEKGHEIARESADTPPGGTKLVTKDGAEFVLDAEQTNRLKNLTDDKNLDHHYDKLYEGFSEPQIDAAEKVFQNQAAGGVGKVATLKEAPAEIAVETAKPVLETIPTAGPMDVHDATTPSKNAPQTLSPDPPPETHESAKEFAKKQALEGNSGEAFVAGAAGAGVAAAALGPGAAKAEESAPKAVMSQEKAKELLDFSQKSLASANQGLVANVAYETLTQSMAQNREQMVSQGMPPDQARAQIAGAVKQNLPQIQQETTQAAQQGIMKKVGEKAQEAKAEAKAKGVPLTDDEANLLGQIRFHKEGLSHIAQENRLAELMGPEAGIPSARDLVAKYNQTGQFDAGGFSRELYGAMEKHQPVVNKRIQDLEQQALKAKDPKEKESLRLQAEELHKHFMGYSDAYNGASIINSAEQSLVAKEVLNTKGASAEPKTLTLLDNGKVTLDKTGATGATEANLTADQLGAKSAADWYKCDANMRVVGLNDDQKKGIIDRSEEKALSMYNNGKNPPKAAKDLGEDHEFAEYMYLTQAGELANFAQQQLGSADPSSERGKALANVAQGGYDYLRSREAYLESQAPNALKGNPQWQAYKSEWGKAAAQLAQGRA